MLLDLNVFYKAAHGQQSNPRNAMLALITFSASQIRSKAKNMSRQSQTVTYSSDMYVGFFSFSLTYLNGDVLEGSWPSYCPDSALFSLWINSELQSARPSICPFHQH